MEDGRKKIWICLLVVVLAAVMIGIIYELSTSRGQAEEGFLIENGEQETGTRSACENTSDGTKPREDREFGHGV